jgi:hypothetical protein
MHDPVLSSLKMEGIRLLFCKLLYMFQMVLPPIIRSTHTHTHTYIYIYNHVQWKNAILAAFGCLVIKLFPAFYETLSET